MDVKTASFKGDLQDEVYMTQFEGLKVKGKENMVYRLTRSIFGLKLTSHQRFLKFVTFGFNVQWINVYISRSVTVDS